MATDALLGIQNRARSDIRFWGCRAKQSSPLPAGLSGRRDYRKHEKGARGAPLRCGCRMHVESQSASLALNDDVSSMIDVETDIMSVPDSLVDEDVWICYRQVDDRKKPIDPNRPQKAVLIDATDTSYAVDFQTALEAVHTSRQSPGADIDGVGIMLDAAPELTLIDVDDVVEDSEIESWVHDMVRDIGSYAEISPSGTGVHILLRDEVGVDEEYSSKDKIECYESKRYCTFTGARMHAGGDEIKRIPGMLGTYQRLHNDEVSSSSSSSTTTSSESADYDEEDFSTTEDLSEKQERLVENMLEHADDKVGELWEEPGAWRCQMFYDKEQGDFDRSDADFYLSKSICFWADKARVLSDLEFSDRELVEVFMASELAQRGKCQKRRDYVPRTIANARGGFGD